MPRPTPGTEPVLQAHLPGVSGWKRARQPLNQASQRTGESGEEGGVGLLVLLLLRTSGQHRITQPPLTERGIFCSELRLTPGMQADMDMAEFGGFLN